jgi:hypothetical protein
LEIPFTCAAGEIDSLEMTLFHWLSLGRRDVCRKFRRVCQDQSRVENGVVSLVERERALIVSADDSGGSDTRRRAEPTGGQ